MIQLTQTWLYQGYITYNLALSQSDVLNVKKYSRKQENLSAPVGIFNAIPSSFFSAAAELAALRHPPAPPVHHLASLQDNFYNLVRTDSR